MHNHRGYRFSEVSKFSLGKREAIVEVTDRISRFSIEPNGGSHLRFKGEYVDIPKRLESEVMRNKGKVRKVRLRINLQTRRIRITAFLNAG